MDPTLSMLMANQALAKPGDLVFDPFVGTGSLLVAAAKYGGWYSNAIQEMNFSNEINHFALANFKTKSFIFFCILAYVMGTDIDYLMLHGKTKPTRVSQKVMHSSRFELNVLNSLQYIFKFRFELKMNRFY